MFKNAGKKTFKLADWLKVDDNFGKAPTLERAFHSSEEVLTISKEFVKFCKANNFNFKISTFAGIVTEELLSNVIIHGATSNRFCLAYIRVIVKEDLIIRVFDNNSKFNPQKVMEKIFFGTRTRRRRKIRTSAG